MTAEERLKSDYLFANGKVIGEFVCDTINYISMTYGGIKEDLEEALRGSCLTNEEARLYLTNKHTTVRTLKSLALYGWHISDLKIYDEPKELEAFRYYNIFEHDKDDTSGEGTMWKKHITRPPQSWCYVEESP